MPVVYRVAKKRHAIYDAAGAVRVGGRWSSPGVAVIYAAEHYATAVLEILVHSARLTLPGAYHATAIFLPDDLRVERFDPGAHPGWELEGSAVARDYGDGWVAARRTPLLAVPSVPGQPVEWNVLINPAHPDAARVRPLDAFDVVWDGRVFGPAPDAVTLAPPSRRVPNGTEA